MVDFARLADLRQKRPLIHCVSNIVSANDCANVALAIGASPMMAQAMEEMEEITALSAATVLNTGTPDSLRYDLCALCGSAANRLGQSVVLDPVGIGASAWRLGKTQAMLEQFRPTIIRLNYAEARTLCRLQGTQQGVDSVEQPTLARRAEVAARLAQLQHAAVLLSGETDVLSDGERVWCAEGGSGLMRNVTGTGCMLSVLCGAFAAVEKDALAAAALASSFWKLCSRRAEAASQGPGTFRAALMDAAAAITSEEFAAEAVLRPL